MEYQERNIGTNQYGVKYYKGMNISYYGVPVTDGHLFDISKYFYRATKFIHKALCNRESKSRCTHTLTHTMYYPLLSIVCLVLSNCRALSLFCLSFFLGKVLGHCLDGVRRSPTLVLAYLMIHHDMTMKGETHQAQHGLLEAADNPQFRAFESEKLQFNSRQTDKNHR